MERKPPPLPPLVCELDADDDQIILLRKDVAETPGLLLFPYFIIYYFRLESSSTSTGAAEDTASLVSETKRPVPCTVASTALRRFSQDRSSAPRVQSTRFAILSSFYLCCMFQNRCGRNY